MRVMSGTPHKKHTSSQSLTGASHRYSINQLFLWALAMTSVYNEYAIEGLPMEALKRDATEEQLSPRLATSAKKLQLNKSKLIAFPAAIVLMILLLVAILAVNDVIIFKVSALKSSLIAKKGALSELRTQYEELKSDVVNLSLTPSASDLQAQYDQLKTEFDSLSESIQQHLLGVNPSIPAKSCNSISGKHSGFYWVLSSNGSTVRVYCAMGTVCGRSNNGGWTRITSLNMKEPSSTCPPSLCTNSKKTRTCRKCPSSNDSCVTQTYQVGVAYSRVCGQITAYQLGVLEAYRYTSKQALGFDGIQLTYGKPKKNIWTFYAAAAERYTVPNTVCPCINSSDSSIRSPPDFIGGHYFCDTALTRPKRGPFYLKDPLWDGAGCGGVNSCCSFNHPPWFYRELPGTTMEHIKMTMCLNAGQRKKELAIEKIDFYVQ